ncbi:hypothetical protein [Evansella cellulosilytica]|uniref:Lipoprotein n=1 Tax=Evansella cellulosilytica (strain ATCC 21833 / DSM 2522 / FERM P-1141 / JCM 9156 / N-4) TaxID=649639 RepID=E6TWK7_EVAC2|nr:hypothetical protein [Evansella cellulosilytica]ADU32270.1 hypothetical protein Bcell_4039 [Evansella cellulosilytica DSM 2522]
MKKKIFLAFLSSVFAVGFLAACGDVNEDMEDPMIEEDGGDF